MLTLQPPPSLVTPTISEIRDLTINPQKPRNILISPPFQTEIVLPHISTISFDSIIPTIDTSNDISRPISRAQARSRASRFYDRIRSNFPLLRRRREKSPPRSESSSVLVTLTKDQELSARLLLLAGEGNDPIVPIRNDSILERDKSLKLYNFTSKRGSIRCVYKNQEFVSSPISDLTSSVPSVGGIDIDNPKISPSFNAMSYHIDEISDPNSSIEASFYSFEDNITPADKLLGYKSTRRKKKSAGKKKRSIESAIPKEHSPQFFDSRSSPSEEHQSVVSSLPSPYMRNWGVNRKNSDSQPTDLLGYEYRRNKLKGIENTRKLYSPPSISGSLTRKYTNNRKEYGGYSAVSEGSELYGGLVSLYMNKSTGYS